MIILEFSKPRLCWRLPFCCFGVAIKAAFRHRAVAAINNLIQSAGEDSYVNSSRKHTQQRPSIRPYISKLPSSSRGWPTAAAFHFRRAHHISGSLPVSFARFVNLKVGEAAHVGRRIGCATLSKPLPWNFDRSGTRAPQPRFPLPVDEVIGGEEHCSSGRRSPDPLHVFQAPTASGEWPLLFSPPPLWCRKVQPTCILSMKTYFHYQHDGRTMSCKVKARTNLNAADQGFRTNFKTYVAHVTNRG